jgi:hypothetical protein
LQRGVTIIIENALADPQADTAARLLTWLMVARPISAETTSTWLAYSV